MTLDRLAAAALVLAAAGIADDRQPEAMLYAGPAVSADLRRKTEPDRTDVDHGGAVPASP